MAAAFQPGAFEPTAFDVGDVQLGLTGVSASGAVGTVVVSFGVAGAQASGSVGILTPNITVALTGNRLNAAVGETIYAVSMSGNSATGNVQSVSIGQRLVQITGSQAMGAVSNFGVLYWSVINDNQTPNWVVINDDL
jgi:hypothetical protein